MLNSSVQKVLKELNKITNSAIIKYPKTVLISDSQDIMLDVDISKLDSEQFPNIHLMNNLGEFIKFLELFDNPEIDLDEKQIVLKQGTMKSSFIFDNPLLMNHLDKDSKQFDRTMEVPSVAEFSISVDDFKNIGKASGVFKDLTEIIFESKDSDVEVVLGATNRFNAKSDTFSILKPSTSNKDFEVKIPVENFKILPVSNYTVHVKYNSEKDSYRLIMVNEDIDLRILLSTKV